ncbi:hypothetical protein F5Y07DRAFT_410697 [Xylaria sp. FL0933]|nr:hypothetical protein F5Y07DRAFT_410697 [Xylaria sp. FL0933]
MSDEKSHVIMESDTTPGDPRNMTLGDSKNFAWVKPSEADAHKRLSIKEQALTVGLKYCEQLINTIEDVFSNITKSSKPSAETIWSLEDRNEWIDQCRSIMKEHRDFRVLVGVAGATGNGKTSVLNALLGFQELLPTNNEEAATAVQCMVSFNPDTRAEYAFRCHVTFQSKEALENRIKQFFDDLQTRNELQNSGSNISIDDEEALHELERTMQPTREMIGIVFDLQDDQVEKLGLEGVLSSNPEAVNLLGTVKEFSSNKADDISQIMKPYMDSTRADHSTSSASFAAWPLIEKVELFVKSEILQNGVTLVDLPGLGDAVHSRELVAERAFDQLAATLIVTQATRAADNSTAVYLMSKHQEMAMMLDGKFHKETFCVCVSQIDQMDRKAALRKPEARGNVKLQGLLAEEVEKGRLKAKLQRRKKDLRGKLERAQRHLASIVKKGLDSTRTATMKAKAKATQKAVKSRLADVSKELIDTECRLTELDNEITFTCIRGRNQFIRDRIRQDFRKRQSRLVAQTPEMQKTYDGQVTVCPTSSIAFWKCKSPDRRMAGFPTEIYTGIPGLANWIRHATIAKREEHADNLLNRLQAQYNTILLWSRDKCRLRDTPITKESFEEHILADVLKSMDQSLAEHWSLVTAEIHRKNPFNGENERLLNKCPEMCVGAVRGWAYKRPDDKASDLVHWTTYKANLTRSGGKFVSRAVATTQEYNWMEDISHILFATIVKDWNQFLNHDVLSLADDAWPVMDKIWDDFMANLIRSVQNAEPRLVPELDNEQPSLETIKTNAKNRVRQVLAQISQDATQFRPQVVEKIQSKWEGTFKEALEITGLGAHRLRQELVLDFAQKRSKRIFKVAYEALQGKLKENLDKLPGELQSISDSALKDLRRYIAVFLDKVLEPTDLAAKSAAIAEERARLQWSIITELAEWTSEWQFPSSRSDLRDDKDDQIPEEYRHTSTEMDYPGDDEYYLDSESDPDRDLDSFSDDNDEDACNARGNEGEDEMEI